ncbi:phosphotransferase family protein [Streptomyces sp. 184]|uniref:phosphotransferase family protein n=1 Tax=Streptomyces sp. 184 TaxID=1827526 RepID=UPI003892664D
MLTAPDSVTDRDVLHAVAAHWLPGADVVEHLPWGFGAHHWRVSGGGTVLFATLDALAPRHTAESLEAAYAGAAALAAAGLESVCAPLRAESESGSGFTVPFGGGALSVTPWVEGRTPTEAEAAEPVHAAEVVRALRALHVTAPPARGLPPWTPRVGPGFAAALRARTAAPWTTGPLAEEARAALAAHGEAVARWTDRYLHLADTARARRASWVPTHGEPHHANQLRTPGGLRFIDWESLALAPPERDYADLPPALRDELGPDPAMLELFALDWRLSEVDEYARWFSAPHTGTEDDHTALAGLHEELADGLAADGRVADRLVTDRPAADGDAAG